MKLAQLFGKNQLDEMQERTMLTIESRGFWLVWSLLLVVLLGEGLLGFTMREMAGTWAVFMIGCVYIVAACLRAGLWSRRIKNTTGTNVLAQPCAGAAVIGVFYICQGCRRIDVPLAIHAGLAPAIAAGTTFVLALVVLQLCGAVVQKSAMNSWKTKLDKEEADNEE